MESDRNELGRRGEDVALRFLLDKGMVLVARNWRNGHLEIDLIMDDGRVLRIVEVRSLSYPNDYDPFESVGYWKRRKIIKAARRFISVTGCCKEVVFDVVSVVFNGDVYRLEYFPDAYTTDW